MNPTTRALRLVVATAAAQSLAVAGCAGSVRGLTAGMAALTAPDAVEADPARVVAAAQTTAWFGLTLCCLWFAAAVLACARDLARHPTRPVPRSALGCLRPAFVRSLLVVLVGGCLANPAPHPVADHGPGWGRLDGLPLPGLPTGLPTSLPTGRSARTAPAHHPRTVDVRPGDCLWTVTATLLGPRATDAQVARAWPLLRRANRAVLGPDPDLVRPGTSLRVPASLQSRPGAPR